mmetsp:Transcript_48590/g.147825  ORF Transcript_48590/g.147825 Transcript_48590/m.147825 type:complete len:215 (+) Transcript_48590:1207-1851(+)
MTCNVSWLMDSTCSSVMVGGVASTTQTAAVLPPLGLDTEPTSAEEYECRAKFGRGNPPVVSATSTAQQYTSYCTPGAMDVVSASCRTVAGSAFSMRVISMVAVPPVYVADHPADMILSTWRSSLLSPESTRVARQYAVPASFNENVTIIFVSYAVGSSMAKVVNEGGDSSSVVTDPSCVCTCKTWLAAGAEGELYTMMLGVDPTPSSSSSSAKQ